MIRNWYLASLCMLQALVHVQGLNLNRHVVGSISHDLLQRRDEETFGLCAAPVSLPSFQLNARDNAFPAQNGSKSVSELVRRAMTLPASNSRGHMDEFVKNEVKSAPLQIIWHPKDSKPQNSALVNTFAGTAISAGTDRLCGCTSLVVVSRLGWYVTHWWEDISFAPNKNNGFASDADALQQTIIDALTVGGRTRVNRQAHPALTASAAMFNDDSVRAFLIIPNVDWLDNRQGYRAAWDLIKQTVGSIIPRLDLRAHGDRWQEVIYRRLEETNPALRDTAAGHELIKYDPDHPAGSGRRKMTLWVEWTQVYNDEW